MNKSMALIAALAFVCMFCGLDASMDILNARVMLEEMASGSSMKRDVGTCFSFQCAGTGAICGFNSSNVIQPCQDCAVNGIVCASSALNDTEKCQCMSDALQCMEQLNETGCFLYEGLVQQYLCPSVAPGCNCGVPNPQYVFSPVCGVGYVCPLLSSTEVFSRCTNLSTIGGPCNTARDCSDLPLTLLGSRDYLCVSHQCQLAPGQSQAGDACSGASDCIGSIPCTGGVCVGIPLSGTCDPFYRIGQCALGLYCNNETMACTATLQLGAKCNYSEQCPEVSGCGGGLTNQVCTPYFSVANGGGCTPGETDCDFGLYCTPSGTCAPQTPGGNICTNDTECAPGYQCVCDFQGSNTCQLGGFQSASVTCKPLEQAFISCVVGSQCPTFSFLPGSCVATKCPFELGCFYNCIEPSLLGPIVGTGCYDFTPLSCNVSTSTTSTTAAVRTSTTSVTTGVAVGTSGAASTTAAGASTTAAVVGTTGRVSTTAVASTTSVVAGTTGRISTTSAVHSNSTSTGAATSDATQIIATFMATLSFALLV